MKTNIGNADRTIRVVAGLIIIGTGLYMSSWWGAIGVVPLVTAFLRWCPAYTLFGISRCGTSSCKT